VPWPEVGGARSTMAGGVLLRRRRNKNPNICSFCGAEKPGQMRMISEKRGIYICLECAERAHQIAREGKQRHTAMATAPAPRAQEAPPAETERLPHALRRRLAENRMCLLVSLPRNDAALARAAVEAGAEGLSVHINVEQAAGGTRFGSLAEEMANLEKIVAVAGSVPVGIVPGAERMASYQDMQQLEALGIDFFDAHADHMPAWMLNMADVQLSRMVTLGARHTPDQVRNLLQGPGHCPADYIDMIQAAIVPADGYGRALTAMDLAAYGGIVELARNRPVLVPTQRRIKPAEVALLREAGVDGIVIGALVTGSNPRELGEATGRFAEAIDRLRR